LGTEPGLVNRTGRPVTAPRPAPAGADTAAFGELASGELALGELAWPAVPPLEICR
jgi:hypothetical protein